MWINYTVLVYNAVHGFEAKGWYCPEYGWGTQDARPRRAPSYSLHNQLHTAVLPSASRATLALGI